MGADASRRIPRKPLPVHDVQLGVLLTPNDTCRHTGNAQPTNSPKILATAYETAEHSSGDQTYPLLPNKGKGKGKGVQARNQQIKRADM